MKKIFVLNKKILRSNKYENIKIDFFNRSD